MTLVEPKNARFRLEADLCTARKGKHATLWWKGHLARERRVHNLLKAL
jgi:hypothetical protein